MKRRLEIALGIDQEIRGNDDLIAFGEPFRNFNAAVAAPAQLDRPWLKTIAATPGEVMGLPHGRMAAGAPAGLVLTRARTMNELLSRPQADRAVLCGGKQVDRTLPDYRELD